MKQIKVNSKCNGCGLCVVNCSYLQENVDGNAEPVAGKSIQQKDLNALKKIVSECPEGALQIVETGTTSKNGIAGAHEIVSSLKKKCDSFSVKRVNNNDIKLRAKDYPLAIPRSIKEYRSDYSSENSARSAARDEFNRLCYSESAYRPMIKKVFVEYKVNILKPYYTCTDTQGSIYYEYNQQIRKMLGDTYAEICDTLGGSKCIPESWRNFSVYPKEKDWSIIPIKEFDIKSTNSGIISELKSISYTGLNDYVDYMDFDYNEEYAGEGLFGRTKYKNKWYFSGFNEAAKSYIKDLTWAIDSMSSDIETEAASNVNYALETFEKQVKDELKIKINELEKYIK